MQKSNFTVLAVFSKQNRVSNCGGKHYIQQKIFYRYRSLVVLGYFFSIRRNTLRIKITFNILIKGITNLF